MGERDGQCVTFTPELTSQYINQVGHGLLLKKLPDYFSLMAAHFFC